MSKEDKKYSRYEILEDLTEHDDLKGVVCLFHKLGRNSMCVGCSQDEDKVEDCKVDLMLGLKKRPKYDTREAIYDKEFDLPLVLKRETPLSNVKDTLGIGLLCDTCHISESCPLYKESHDCGIDWTAGVDSRKPKDVMDYLIKIQMERISRAQKMEEIDGGMPDQTTSGEMDRLSGLVTIKDSLDEDRFSMKIEGTAKGEGGGILSKLFGAASTPKSLPEKEETIEIPHTDTIPEPIKVKDEKRVKKFKRLNLKAK